MRFSRVLCGDLYSARPAGRQCGGTRRQAPGACVGVRDVPRHASRRAHPAAGRGAHGRVPLTGERPGGGRGPRASDVPARTLRPRGEVVAGASVARENDTGNERTASDGGRGGGGRAKLARRSSSATRSGVLFVGILG